MTANVVDNLYHIITLAAQIIILMENLLESVRKVALNAANYIKSQVGQVSLAQIEEKELNSLVSYVDKQAELLIVSELTPLVQGAGFITEEDTIDSLGKDYQWVIDPLDGTTNFLMSVPHYCVSIALQYKGETIIGVVREVMSNQEFYAASGDGAYLNGEPIKVSKYNTFDQILVATGFPYRNNYKIEAYFDVIKEVLVTSRGMRRMGSAALDLCYVACGRFGCYYESLLNPWDIAAGALIVQEAGGVVSDFKGNDQYSSGKEILASAPQFHDKAVKLISPLSL